MKKTKCAVEKLRLLNIVFIKNLNILSPNSVVTSSGTVYCTNKICKQTNKFVLVVVF